jgi:hypothetical protein
MSNKHIIQALRLQNWTVSLHNDAIQALTKEIKGLKERIERLERINQPKEVTSPSKGTTSSQDPNPTTD